MRIPIPDREKDVIVFTKEKYEDTIPAEMTHDNIRQALRKLAEYEDLEEQGLLLKLPCKVGDTVWFVGNKFVNDYEIRRFIIDEIGIDAIQVAKTIKGKDYWNSFNIDDFGKTVFLTQEQAEEALKKMGETEENT